MQGPIFTVAFSAVAVTAAQDLFSLLAHTSSRIAICRIEIAQYSDAGDAASELLPILMKTGATVVGSGGSAPTPQNVAAATGSSVAAVTTARANDTTQAGTGTIVTRYAGVWNVQAGFLYAPRWDALTGYDERIRVAAGQRFVLDSPAAPADSLTMNGTIWFQELGLFSG